MTTQTNDERACLEALQAAADIAHTMLEGGARPETMVRLGTWLHNQLCEVDAAGEVGDAVTDGMTLTAALAAVGSALEHDMPGCVEDRALDGAAVGLLSMIMRLAERAQGLPESE